jgi:excisionase family DNA binding protein
VKGATEVQTLRQHGQPADGSMASSPRPFGAPPPLLDAHGAAALLNVPATWVLAEARANRIPYVRLGRYVRFDAAELQLRWLGRRRGPWRSIGAAASTAQSRQPLDEAAPRP